MVKDSTNIIDTSILLKGRLKKNMVGDNYYIEDQQTRRNRDWDYRYNVVDIEEELEKQIEYTSTSPVYTPIEAVVNNVKPVKGEAAGTDTLKLMFKDLKHPCDIGYRYRFSTNFSTQNLTTITEEEKHYSTSIWLCTNKTPASNGNAVLVKRCNTTLTLLGSPNDSVENVTETHIEPVVLETALQAVSTYNSAGIPMPQGEYYLTLQLNYFTNFINLNDRFLFGTLNSENRNNNQAFKVIALFKSATNHTFVRNSADELKSTPILLLALEKSAISADDDLVSRQAGSTTIYHVTTTTPMNQYYLQVDKDSIYTAPDRLILTEVGKYKVNVHYDDSTNSIVPSPNITFSHKLGSQSMTDDNTYYKFTRLDSQSFSIQDKKANNSNYIEVLASWTDSETSKTYTCSQTIRLGGFY